MTRGIPRPDGDARADATETPASVGRPAVRRPRPTRTSIPRRRVEVETVPSRAELATLRAQLLRSVLRLPAVAIGDSRLDDDAAGMFVRVPRDGPSGFEVREFATLRDRGHWSLSVVLPTDAMVDLQRLGWGRPRPADRPGPLLLELTRPRTEADLAPLQDILAAAHRAAANPRPAPHGRKR